ncbi:CocE/NonD family hydrolase [Steroidobacter sp.]|uniref:CocE/NonD family hydrolase n=1 Tax=Steroidobacter sp. TaxID=1978227 RepID=UPI001A3F8BC1|nr:CocE/NonD family hydrolase [Steroidobacter sp.]MBL8271261.1 CocE/NonD family hydrolase [Steroidobacter sp.]
MTTDRSVLDEVKLTRRQCLYAGALALLGVRAASATGRLFSRYVRMRDGTRIAVDIWLPADLGTRKVGTILQPTRYTRAFQKIGASLANDSNFETAELINNAGMAYAIADGRGTGASFGSRGGELTAAEFDDFGQLIDWLSTQSFSNGRVGAMGSSYPGTLAENLAKMRRPALRAVAPRFNYFDVYRHLSVPGGLYSRTFMDRWRQLVGVADRVPEFVCAEAARKQQTCAVFAATLPIPKPVDGPEGLALLQAAQREHASNVSFAGLVDANKLLFRDDARDQFSWTTMSPAGDLAAIEQSNVAYFVQASWLDAASAAGALQRFGSLRNVQQVQIGAWSHGGAEVCDPLLGPASGERSEADVLSGTIAFFSQHLSDAVTPKQTSSKLSYYVMGSGEWRETSVWPPAGTRLQRRYLHPDGTLQDAVAPRRTTVPLAIVTNHGTGKTARWGARPTPVAFDRTRAAGLTAFTTAAFERPCVLAGNVRCGLRLTCDQPDGSVFVYMDVVLPTGELRYLTEVGQRLIHRLDWQAPAGSQAGFTRAEARAVPTGEPFELLLELLPIAARIEAGWRLRVSFADRDVDWFDRYDDGRAPAIGILVGEREGSWVELPTMLTR